MPTAQLGAGAALLTDGRVLVAGGATVDPSDSDPEPLASTELFDATSDSWVPAPPLPEAVVYPASAPLPGDRALVAGGMTADGQATAAAAIYDGATNTWSQAAPMNVPRDQAAAAALPDGRVVVIGGAGNDEAGYSVEIYDPSTNTWSFGASAPGTLVGATAVTLPDGDVLVTGGFDGDEWASAQTDADLYDPSTNSWSVDEEAEPAYPLIGGGAATLPDGRAVVIGGSTQPGTEQTPGEVQVYEPFAPGEEWATDFDIPGGLYAPAVAPLPNGDVLVAGGEANFAAVSDAQEFTPAPAPAVMSVEVV